MPSAWKRSAFPLSLTPTTSLQTFPTDVCIGAVRTKEQSQQRVRSLIPIMVLNDRATYKDRYALISSWPGETIST